MIESEKRPNGLQAEASSPRNHTYRRYLSAAACLSLLSACGSAPSVTLAQATRADTQNQSATSTTHTFSLVTQGQGVGLGQTIITDQGTSTQTQTWIPSGGGVHMILVTTAETFSATAQHAQLQLSRVSGGGTTLNVWIYVDGVLRYGPLQYTDGQNAQWNL